MTSREQRVGVKQLTGLQRLVLMTSSLSVSARRFIAVETFRLKPVHKVTLQHTDLRFLIHAMVMKSSASRMQREARSKIHTMPLHSAA